MSVAAGQDAACLPVFQATWVILLSSVAGHRKRHCAGGKAAVRESLGPNKKYSKMCAANNKKQ